MSRSEKEVAELIKAKMQELGYDIAKIDEAGNVIGIIKSGRSKRK